MKKSISWICGLFLLGLMIASCTSSPGGVQTAQAGTNIDTSSEVNATTTQDAGDVSTDDMTDSATRSATTTNSASVTLVDAFDCGEIAAMLGGVVVMDTLTASATEIETVTGACSIAIYNQNALSAQDENDNSDSFILENSLVEISQEKDNTDRFEAMGYLALSDYNMDGFEEVRDDNDVSILGTIDVKETDETDTFVIWESVGTLDSLVDQIIEIMDSTTSFSAASSATVITQTNTGATTTSTTKY